MSWWSNRPKKRYKLARDIYVHTFASDKKVHIFKQINTTTNENFKF